MASNAAHFIVGGHTFSSEQIWIEPNYDFTQLETDPANISATGDNRAATLEVNEPLNSGISAGNSVW